MVHLSVADQGEGIAPEHIARVTERFYRVDTSRSRSLGGTGLGLSIVKHIVERHRGRLSIESELGKGTTCARPAARRQRAGVMKVSRGAARGGHDDQAQAAAGRGRPRARRPADLAFRARGFRVVRTADGEEALLLAEERTPDIVILDWMIEGMSGIEVCRRLRREAATANVPIIMLTARGEESDRIRGLETGADDYVTKPFSPRELVARVGAVLRRVRPALAGEQLRYADIEMDVVAHKVRRGGEAVALGPTEFRLLRHLLEHPGRVFSRERLLDAVWAHDPRHRDAHRRRPRPPVAPGAQRGRPRPT